MDSLAIPNSSQNTAGFAALREELLVLLQSSQNADGGWAFHTGGESRVEPTCWAVRALADGKSGVTVPEIARAVGFLKSKQLGDGSWPANDGMQAGGWITSLACGVLAGCSEAPAPELQKAIEAGLQWLCDDYPRDSSGWQKFLNKIQSKKNLVEQSDEFRGWGWTPRTSSWVEPTAFALMAFADTKPGAQLAKSIAERRAMAIGLLCDRMCPRGGWNCGNPRVYGVDGDPLVLPTCWALLALRDEKTQEAGLKPGTTQSAPRSTTQNVVGRSVEWLREEFGNIQSAGSLAMASITLESYGIAPAESRRRLVDWQASDLLEQGTHVAAWTSLALNPSRSWPARGSGEWRVASGEKP